MKSSQSWVVYQFDLAALMGKPHAILRSMANAPDLGPQWESLSERFYMSADGDDAAYQKYLEIFNGDRFARLRETG